MEIKNKAFLVTGAASGLGQASTRKLAALGGKIVIADIDEQAGQKLAEELGSQAAFIATDVTSSNSVNAAVKHAQDQFGGLHGVVHCAGILGAAKVLGRNGPQELELFAKVVQVNLVGTFNVVRLAAHAMAANEPTDEQERGVIITTSSVAAFEGQIGQAGYSASKGGVAGMTLPIARELSTQGIRVVSIAPGVFSTPMMEGAPEKVVAALQSQALFPPRFGAPEEYAALAVHIFENLMLNGSVIRLDGAVRMPPR